MNEIRFLNFNDNEFEIVKKIRETVFTKEQGAAADEDIDAYDKDALFLLLYVDDVPAATARLARTAAGCKIGRIAVLKEYRGLGLGAWIVREITQKAFDSSADYVLVDAQNYAVPFYEKLGFEVIGTQILDRGLPHIPMKICKESFYGKEKEQH